MTLEDLIAQYKMEQYKFWKFCDKDGKEIKTHFFFESHADYLDKYLGFYKTLPNLTELIIHASDGIFKLTNQGIEYFIRHNHQEVFLDKEDNLRGIPYELSKQVRNNLIKRTNDILKSTTFDNLFQIVLESKVKGFGELSIYDTALRIASQMNIEPDKVYLHAGSRKGAELLEEKGYIKEGSSKKKYLKIEDLPLPLQSQKADDTQHFFCSMKDKMRFLDVLTHKV